MGWERDSRFPFYFYGLREGKSQVQHLGVIERCFIRKEHECGKIFGASKSCFIACPTDADLNPILEILSEKLMKVGIEPIIAVRERAYGQDIFCTKICGKIIESKFCVAILDDSKTEKGLIPNPNVYYEYGLMTSLRKHIIPLQHDGLELAFNIQSYDTVKYTSGNIGFELDRAIKDAIRITEKKEKEEKKGVLSEKSLLRRIEMCGFEEEDDDDWFLWDTIADTQFKGFFHPEKNTILYLGRIEDPQDFEDYIDDIKLVIYRNKKKKEELIKEAGDINSRIKTLEDKKSTEYKTVFPSSFIRNIDAQKSEEAQLTSRISMMNHIYFGFLIKKDLDATNFSKKTKEIIDTEKNFEIIVSEPDVLNLGEISIKLIAE